MKTERNEFQRLVDHQLANVQWERRMSAAVLRKLHEDSPRPRPVLRYALAFALVALVLGVSALSILRRPPAPDQVIAVQPAQTTVAPVLKPETRAEAVHLARQAVMEKYGLTLHTLGVFRDDCQLTDSGWVVRFFTTGMINRRLAGEYTVEKTNGFITASWTHDDVDPSVYADGSLNRVAWGHQQLLYARTAGSSEAMAINRELNAAEGTQIDYSYFEGTELWGDPLTNVTPADDAISVDDAITLVYDALAHHFSLTSEQVHTLMGDPLLPEHASLRQSTSGIRVWVFHPTLTINDVDYYTAVCINAATGELERLEYTTLGNG